MVRFDMLLAGKIIAVEALYESTARFCKEYFAPDGSTPDISVSVTLADVAAERIKSAEERRLEGLPPYDFPDPYLETLALYRRIAEGLLPYGIILFHGSSLSIDGQGIIFTAKSGTGKSTHTRIWRRVFGDRVRMINDDKPLLTITDREVTVHGTPWCGKHAIGENISAPLRSICVIERSPDNNIRRVNGADALMRLLPQIYRIRTPDAMRQILGLTDKLLASTPVYILGCNMEDSAATVAYGGMFDDLGN